MVFRIDACPKLNFYLTFTKSSNSGPEVRPVSLDSQPSEMFGQGLTNLMGPVRQSIASALTGQRVQQQQPETRASLSNPQPLQGTTSGEDSNTNGGGGRSLIEQLAGQFLGTSSARRDDEDTRSGGFRSNRGISTFGSTENSRGENNLDGMVGQAMRLFSVDNGNKNNLITPSDDRRNFFSSSSSSASSKSVGVFPKLDQLFPGAQKNFGFKQGEGCVPFLGEFMKIAYGNCVKQADEKVDMGYLGKGNKQCINGRRVFSIILKNQNCFTGKIDLLRASKETCKMGAEREHCGQLRRAISGCDILGSINLATNMQRSVSRCDQVTGLIDRNPSTVLSQMNGLINGEMAQGILNNFLG
uniref:Uncharacterized protein n=2 Tax=Meloidogyne TaxID=189290 RepID=A0A914LHG4_MELIC